jgi:hypothetical protein
LNSFKSVSRDPPVRRPPSPTLLASLSHAMPQIRAMAAGRRPPSSHRPYHRHCNRITCHHDRLLPRPTTRPLGLIHVSTPRAEDVTLHSPPLSLSLIHELFSKRSAPLPSPPLRIAICTPHCRSPPLPAPDSKPPPPLPSLGELRSRSSMLRFLCRSHPTPSPRAVGAMPTRH